MDLSEELASLLYEHLSDNDDDEDFVPDPEDVSAHVARGVPASTRLTGVRHLSIPEVVRSVQFVETEDADEIQSWKREFARVKENITKLLEGDVTLPRLTLLLFRRLGSFVTLCTASSGASLLPRRGPSARLYQR